MRTQERTIYKCDYCRKYYLMQKSCERHEIYCRKNPANMHICYHCKFLTVDRDGDTGHKIFHCDKFDKQMHSVVAERIGHSCLGYTERMPINCSEYIEEGLL